MTRHLVHLGHRDICVISGPTRDNDRTTTRLAGIRLELTRHGIALGPERVIECSYSIANGREACAALLERIQPRPTVLICGNDVLALGALVECRGRGLRVPEEISIVGFDNLELSRHSNPPLTTVDVPSERMGDAAAGYLLDRLDDKEVPPQTSVEVQLILRDTTAPPVALAPRRKPAASPTVALMFRDPGRSLRSSRPRPSPVQPDRQRRGPRPS